MGTDLSQFDLYLWSNCILLAIDRARSDTHLHGAMQLTVGVEGPIRVGHEQTVLSGRAILVAPNQPHWFESGGVTAVWWLEPESRVCRRLTEAFLRDAPLAALDEAALGPLAPGLSGVRARQISDSDAHALRHATEAAWLDDHAPAPPLHPAVKRAVRHIESLETIKIGLPELCEVVGVSRSHLMHQFKESLGMPLRRYLLWHRVRRAFVAIAAGANATETAAAAGFYDSPHLTRVFKQLLDLTPSELLRMKPKLTVRELSDDV